MVWGTMCCVELADGEEDGQLLGLETLVDCNLETNISAQVELIGLGLLSPSLAPKLSKYDCIPTLHH